MAWTTILKGRFDFRPDLGPAHIDFLRFLFPDEDIVEERGFTILHQLVIGLRIGKLEDELQKPETDIDAIDNQGKTALIWAAQRGDSEAVASLLEHGADPNVPSQPDGQIALNYSCIPPKTDCLKLLLRPSVRSKIIPNKKGWTALHLAAHYQDDPEFLQLLIGKGFDIEARTTRGRTPLASAAERNNVRAARYLIQQGAKINTLDEEGFSPLFLAVSWGSVAVARLLLRFKPDYRHKTKVGGTILHCAATSPNREMFQLLGFGLDGVDAEARNDMGFTAKETLLQKASSAEFLKGFEELLGTVVGS
jgi:ankyrin repeat protein